MPDPAAMRAKQLLAIANYARVGERLGVSRAQVARWAKGDQVTPWQLMRLEELYAAIITGRQQQPPEWAARLLTSAFAVEAKLGITDAEREAARAHAAHAALEAVEAELGLPPRASGDVQGAGSA